MIVKPLSQDDPYGLLDEEPDAPAMEVDLEAANDEDEPGVVENEDGTITVDLEPKSDVSELSPEHGANLADDLSDSDRTMLSQAVTQAFEQDLSSRKDWEEAYIAGLDLLGVKLEERTQPWNGACGVFHPLVTEAVIRFVAQAIMEVFPPQGPCKTKIIGKETTEKRAMAVRVQEEMNYLLTEKMGSYRDDTESMLFRMAMAGSAFRKVYFNTLTQLPEAKFVAAEDLVIPYGEPSLKGAERFTQISRMSQNEVKKLQSVGFFRKVNLTGPVEVQNGIDSKESELSGQKPVGQPDHYEMLEMHLEYDLGEDPNEIALPYVVTVEKASGTVMAVRRNWREDDPLKLRRSYFVQHKYLPGLGAYGFGLIHLIGGLARSSTAILRQLVDAGTLANLPGGLKSRGLRIKGDDTPIRPGEFRDVDIAAGKISDSITFLPHKEPSAVLYQLLGNLVDEGRRIGSISDMDIGDGNQEAPVGTTLALMERALKVMTSIQARLHSSIGDELKLLADVVRDEMPPQYDYDVGGPFDRSQDFGGGVDIVPVSDPGATTMSQRVVQHQAALTMSSQAPELYDRHKLHRTFLEVLGIKDAAEMVPSPPELKPKDPLTENMDLLKGSPVKVFAHQDHQAHIMAHMAAAQDPKLLSMIQMSPQAQVVQGAMAAHITEHIAFAYHAEVQAKMGGQMPPPDQPMSPEQEAMLAQAVAQASQAVGQQNQAEAQQAQQEEAMKDPLVQIAFKELELKEAEMNRKAETDFAKLQQAAATSIMRDETERERIKTQLNVQGAQIGAKVGAQKAETMQKEMDSRRKLQAASLKSQMAKGRATPAKDD